MSETKNPLRVLVVDDDPAARRSLEDILAQAGYEVTGAGSAAEARRLVEGQEPALAVLDLVLPDGDGIRLLEDLRASWPAMPALIVTGYVETRSVVEAMRRGALDYLAKPVDPEVLLSACRAALARRPRPAAVPPSAPLPIVGDSIAAMRIRESVQHLARTRPAGVLIAGERGAGKRWIAQALHAASTRRAAPCLVYPCTAAHDPALALLGMGAPPAGGLFQAALGGTVILEDVDQLAADVQLAVLRRLETVPAWAPMVVGLTTAAATTSPLLAWLGRATIAVPPLRERASDVVPLARHFLAAARARSGRAAEGFTASAEHALLDHTWPDNVHELAEVVERAAEACPAGPVRPEHLAIARPVHSEPVSFNGTLRRLRDIEDAYIDHVLAATGGNRTRAARILGVARETLRVRMLTRRAAS